MRYKREKTKILAWPKVGFNPYNEILYAQFEEYGVTVISHRDDRLAGITSHVDVFHFHWLNAYLDHGALKALLSTFAFMAYILLLKIKKTKIIWTVHNTVSFTHHGKNSGLEKLLVSFLLKHVDLLIVHSKYQINHFSEQYQHKVTCIPHHNYCSILRKKLLKKNNYYLFFGSISPYKGLDCAIQAYNAASCFCKLPPFKIIGCINDAAYKKTVTALVHDNNGINLEDRFVANDELEMLVKEAEAVILPFAQITNSGSLLYALSCRVPVFVKKSILIDELISQHKGLENVLLPFETEAGLVSLLTGKVEIDNADFDSFIESTNIDSLVNSYMDVLLEDHM